VRIKSEKGSSKEPFILRSERRKRSMTDPVSAVASREYVLPFTGFVAALNGWGIPIIVARKSSRRSIMKRSLRPIARSIVQTCFEDIRLRSLFGFGATEKTDFLCIRYRKSSSPSFREF
jgi:hypothetical protein